MIPLSAALPAARLAHGARCRRKRSPCSYLLPANDFALLLRVDTPSKGQLIASNKSVEEIRAYIGADSLAYLSLEGLQEACAKARRRPIARRAIPAFIPQSLFPGQIQTMAVEKKS